MIKQHDEQHQRYEEELFEAAEAAKEASRLKSVFLANMSHEIRTPMNGIIGFADLALDDTIAPQTQDYLKKIKTSSEGLLQIINDILDISKIEAGKIALENIPFDIHKVFRTCQIITTPKALEKGVTLFCYAEPSIDKRLLGDPTRLRQVLLNLLSNAIKFTNVGIVKLLLFVEETTENSVRIHFEVKDSGIGMPAHQINRIFTPFMQGDDSMTRKYGGTGLGLPITKNLIELMGGELTVESATGVGSKFSFCLTFTTVNLDSEPAEQESETDIIEKPVFKGNVLVVEDNIMNQQVLCDHLARVGLHTVITQDGRECVEHVRYMMEEGEPSFDLIFMDIHMPVMDGLEAAKQLSLLGNTTPIVAVTANIMPNDREIYRQVGMLDCLAKPFSSNELWSCLLKYIKPAGVKIINKKEQSETDDVLHSQLLFNFWQDNQTTCKEIKTAIEAGEIKLAFRKAHTLKGVSGLIGKNLLRDAAYAVECALAGGRSDATPKQLDVLESELRVVMNELAVMYDNTPRQVKGFPYDFETINDKANIFMLIEKLEPMLEFAELEVLDLVDELRKVPNTGILIDRIEHYDFIGACTALSNIKKGLVNDDVK